MKKIENTYKRPGITITYIFFYRLRREYEGITTRQKVSTSSNKAESSTSFAVGLSRFGMALSTNILEFKDKANHITRKGWVLSIIWFADVDASVKFFGSFQKVGKASSKLVGLSIH